MNLCGCFRCGRKNNGNGNWPSKGAIVYCETQKADMRKAHENGTPYQVFECEYKTIRPLRVEETAIV